MPPTQIRAVSQETKTPSYNAPVLFPLWKQYMTTDTELNGYIRDELVKMAEAGTLVITDILQQPGRVWMAAGMAILGQVVNPETKVMTVDQQSIPPQLQTYSITVKSIVRKRTLEKDGQKVEIEECSPIRWKSSQLRPRTVMGARGSAKTNTQMVENTWMEPFVDGEPVTEAELYLRDAWLCLRQGGEFCNHAPREGIRFKKWLYREVRAEPLEQSETPEKGTARPNMPPQQNRARKAS